MDDYKYCSDLKQKLISEGFVEVSEKIGQLKMLAKDDAQEAGKITGKARREIEGKIGKKIAEKTNYRNLTQNGLKQIKSKEESDSDE